MQHRLHALSACLAISVLLGCTQERKSAAGFRLPDGDAERGYAVLVDLKCATCHRIEGHDELPAPSAEPSVPVALGGRFARVPSDGDLFTSIVNPSHKISSRYAHDMVKAGELSRMGNFSETMTVQEMIDLVAFLHTLYEHDEASADGRVSWRQRQGG